MFSKLASLTDHFSSVVNFIFIRCYIIINLCQSIISLKQKEVSLFQISFY